MAAELTKSELEKNIKEIIKDGDLATLTSKKVRQILEQKYNTSLKERKKEIDDIVMALVDEQSEDESSSPKRTSNTSESEQSSPSKKQKVSERVSVIVPSKKKKTESSDSEEVDSDEDDDEDEDYDEKPKKRSTTKRKTAKSPEKKPRAKKSSGAQSDKPKRKSGFSIPMVLSPELSELMGETHMARAQIVKRMWQYVKENNLADPSNKRYTICNEPLEAIIGQKRFLTFSMMKYLNKHVKDPALFT